MKATKEQLNETSKEINDLLNYGAKKISLNEYKNMLANFGLKLDMDTKSCLLKYYNTSNDQKYLCATTTALDQTGNSYANVNGSFYQKHLKNDTPTAKQFREFKQDYFCVLDSGHILSI